MKKLFLIIALVGMLTPLSFGQEKKEEQFKIEWRPLKIAKSQFPRSIAMMDAERDNYAGNLAGVAIVQLRDRKVDKSSRELALRMMSVALHLSPRNKRAVVLNAQLGRGMVPQPPEVDYQPKTLSALLMNRAKLLEKEGGKENVGLAGYLFHLASELDPKNEDAIYLSELFRINHGEVDWSKLLLNRE